jgi:hypothetical protein
MRIVGLRPNWATCQYRKSVESRNVALGKPSKYRRGSWLILGERWHAIDHRLELRSHNRRLRAIEINGERAVAILEISSDVAVRKLPKNIFYCDFCCRFRPVNFREEFSIVCRLSLRSHLPTLHVLGSVKSSSGSCESA